MWLEETVSMAIQDDDDVTDPVSNSNTMVMPPSRRSKIEQLCTVTDHVAKMVALSCGGTEKEGAEGGDGGGVEGVGATKHISVPTEASCTYHNRLAGHAHVGASLIWCPQEADGPKEML